MATGKLSDRDKRSAYMSSVVTLIYFKETLMTVENEECCGTCEFWTGVTVGDCHRYPPSVTLDLVAYSTDPKLCWMPLTEYDEWCGEYKTRRESETCQQ